MEIYLPAIFILSAVSNLTSLRFVLKAIDQAPGNRYNYHIKKSERQI